MQGISCKSIPDPGHKRLGSDPSIIKITDAKNKNKWQFPISEY